MGARTDRTALCIPCAVRTSPGGPCPSCGALELQSLSPALKALPPRLGQPPAPAPGALFTRVVKAYLQLGAPVLSTLAMAVALFTTGSLEGAWAGLVLSVFGHVAILVVLFAGFGIARVFHGADVEEPPVRIEPLDRPSRSRPARLRGRVHLTRPVTSPLGHLPCGAYRLVGTGPLGAIDDGEGGSFEVRGGHGVARVDARSATLEIPVARPPRTIRLTPELRRFLDERGAFSSLGAVRLAEATIQEGDVVEVLGAQRMRTEATGLRDQTSVIEIAEEKGQRLLIRRTSP